MGRGELERTSARLNELRRRLRKGVDSTWLIDTYAAEWRVSRRTIRRYLRLLDAAARKAIGVPGGGI